MCVREQIYLQFATSLVVLVFMKKPAIYLQFTTFLVDPIKNDVAYQAKAQPFLVLGILTTALACGHHTF
ncbi:hypothetical protein T484DRAFT_1839273 [Baffinella frigidus]|nr:hypothetical protein T484DRAFT_1839273 [Cryptophyta sp. CCMP2293]